MSPFARAKSAKSRRGSHLVLRHRPKFTVLALCPLPGSPRCLFVTPCWRWNYSSKFIPKSSCCIPGHRFRDGRLPVHHPSTAQTSLSHSITCFRCTFTATAGCIPHRLGIYTPSNITLYGLLPSVPCAKYNILSLYRPYNIYLMHTYT